MKTKLLYILVQDCDDGSYTTVFTLDSKWIKKQKDLYDCGILEGNSIGVDSEGFHYKTIQVPADATYESLGIGKHSFVGESS